MRFLAKLLKHWYLYLIPVLLLPAAGALYGRQKLSVYETSALLWIYSSDTVAGANTQFNQYVSPAQNGSDLINEYMQSNNFVVTIAESTDLRRHYDLTNSADKDIVVQRIRGDVLINPTGVAWGNNVTLLVDDNDPQLPLRPTLHLKGLIPYFGGGLAAALALILLIVGTRTVLDRKVYSTRDLRTITEELELDIPLLTEIPVLKTLTRSNRRQHGDDDVLSGV